MAVFFVTRRHLYTTILCYLFVVHSTTKAWKQCSEEDGGGQCPDMATCCPTDTPGISSCITTDAQSPDGQGTCCDSNTGCGYSYECAVQKKEEEEDDDDDNEEFPYCKLEQSHPGYLKYDIPRYELCTVPQEMQDYHGFAIFSETTTVSGEEETQQQQQQHQLAYLSNMGPIDMEVPEHLSVEDVLIIIHGSSRNADDYFCAGLSIIAPSTTTTTTTTRSNTLVIVPRFSAKDDDIFVENQLVWAEERDEGHALSHSWRYGADALNAPVSSYGTLDLIVEYLANAKVQYPHLKRISVAGHSAGAQVTHRWTLLSNSPVWDLPIEIRAIVANPRSFCYLDDRRIIDENGKYDVPSSDDTALCPGYDQWQWGLEPGGRLACPYKDRAIAESPQLADRYATRQVIYLSGEYDTDVKPDQCETIAFQGKNRRERSARYFQALEAYFGKPVHERHVVPKTPHDHFLMLQSDEGRNAIFGGSDDKNNNDYDKDDDDEGEINNPSYHVRR